MKLAHLHGNQFLLFAHEENFERRKIYLKWLAKSVSEGLCDPSRVPDFILRTEYLQKGYKLFLQTLEQREGEIRKEYNLPDYYFKIS